MIEQLTIRIGQIEWAISGQNQRAVTLLEFNNKNITNRFNSYKIHFSANTNREKSYILPQIYDKTARFLGFLAIFKQKVQDYCKIRN